MATLWISLTDIPAEGREFSFTDQSIWTDQLDEFGYEYNVTSDFEASVRVQPQKKAVLIEGRITGGLDLPCDRCTQPAGMDVDETFQVYEALPGEEGFDEEQSFLRFNGPTLELNVSGLVWEQFLLSMPPKLLCQAECKGLCIKCGQDLNLEECDCEKEEGDPRMAVFKNLKIT